MSEQAKTTCGEFSTQSKTQAPAIVYHYTSPKGLLGIIGHREIWLSDCAYLNDSLELAHADNMLRAIISDLKSVDTYGPGVVAGLDAIATSSASGDFVRPLSFSVSEEGDLLSQWRAYCPCSGGYAIGFANDFWRGMTAPFSFTLRQCVYDQKRQRSIIDEALRLSLTEDKGEHAITSFELYYRFIRPTLKHPSFSEEKEWRLLSVDDHSLFDGIRFQAADGFVVPYYPMRFSDAHLPIVEVVVGPSSSPHLAAVSVEHLLRSNRLEYVGVRVSDSPLRTL